MKKILSQLDKETRFNLTLMILMMVVVAILWLTFPRNLSLEKATEQLLRDYPECQDQLTLEERKEYIHGDKRYIDHHYNTANYLVCSPMEVAIRYTP